MKLISFSYITQIIPKESGRLMLWFPVILAFGIGLYFSLPVEPPSFYVYSITAALFLGCGLSFIYKFKFRYFLFVLSIFAAGFLAAKVRISLLDVEILKIKQKSVLVRGQVVSAQINSKGGLSIIIDKVKLTFKNKSNRRIQEFSAKIKMLVRRFDKIPKTGNIIEVFAILNPPPMPSYPDGFHYGQYLWFKGIGATGFSLSKIKVISESVQHGTINSIRSNIHERILRASNSAETKINDKAEIISPENEQRLNRKRSYAVASALITGMRGAIDKSDYEAMRNAGLAHVLAISGLHMGLLCGAVFFISRLLLTSFGSAALFFSTKKYAAIIAMIAGAIYLFLSGMGVPSMRAYIMVLIMLSGILFNRKSISLRIIAIAATVILIFSPEALLSVSFQMSFAAVIGLVFFYEKYGDRFFSKKDSKYGFISKIFYYFLATIFTALIAEIAIAPIVIYHFNHLPIYGIIANLLVMPIITFWIMPFLLLTLLLLPFGLEHISLLPMCEGIEMMLNIAHYISNQPSSTIYVPKLNPLSFYIIIISALWFLLWKEKWRIIGVATFFIGIGLNLNAKKPDILLDPKALYFAVTNNKQELFVSSLRLSKRIQNEWADLYSGIKLKKWTDRDESWIKCDKLSCIYRIKDHVIAFVKNENALHEDCENADIVIGLIPIEIKCQKPKLVIDKWDIYNNGSYAIFLSSNKRKDINNFTFTNSRIAVGKRPWSLY